jgi:hypothetical protein
MIEIIEMFSMFYGRNCSYALFCVRPLGDSGVHRGFPQKNIVNLKWQNEIFNNQKNKMMKILNKYSIKFPLHYTAANHIQRNQILV